MWQLCAQRIMRRLPTKHPRHDIDANAGNGVAVVTDSSRFGTEATVGRVPSVWHGDDCDQSREVGLHRK